MISPKPQDQLQQGRLQLNMLTLFVFPFLSLYLFIYFLELLPGSILKYQYSEFNVRVDWVSPLKWVDYNRLRDSQTILWGYLFHSL